MSIEPVWELAARVHAEARVPVRVLGPPPPVTWIANDEKTFSYNVGPLTGSGKLDVIAFGATQDEAESAIENELPRLLFG